MTLGGSPGMLFVIMRCNRWGTYVRWLARGGSDPRPKRVVSWWHKIITSRLLQQPEQRRPIDDCPVNLEEARETWQCIDALPVHLRDVIVEEYGVGGTADQKAEALGIKANSFRDRRENAHALLLGLFNDAAAGLPLRVPCRTRGRPPVARPST